MSEYRHTLWWRGLPAVLGVCLGNLFSTAVPYISRDDPPSPARVNAYQAFTPLPHMGSPLFQGGTLGGSPSPQRGEGSGVRGVVQPFQSLSFSPPPPSKSESAFSLSGAPANVTTGSSENPPPDLKTAVVEAFMAARALENNVEARKLMTAHLEHVYLHRKRLSIRVRSSRIVSFDFDPAKISQSGEKEFNVEVESIWADLNEQVFATQYERIKFVKVKNEWLADRIDFLRTVPAKPLLPLNVESDKRAQLALAVVKKFLKAIANRQPTSATQFTTQEFQTNVGGQNKLEELLTGPVEPHYTAFDLRTFTQKDKKEIEMKVGLYLVQTGKKGGTVSEARLTLRLGRTEWNVDNFQIVGAGQKASERSS